jgi:hypothetical protein
MFFWALELKGIVKYTRVREDRSPPKKGRSTGHRLALVPVVYEFEYDPNADQPFKWKETSKRPLWLDSADLNKDERELFYQRILYLPWLHSAGVSEDERKLFYKGLLRIPWLPAKVRSALLKETGTSRRKIAESSEIARTFVLWFEVNECKDRMRRERDHYRWCKKHPNLTDWYKKHPNLTDRRVRFPRHSWDGHRPNPVRGSLYEAAIEEVASKHRMTAAALKKRIQRHRPSQLLR